MGYTVIMHSEIVMMWKETPYCVTLLHHSGRNTEEIQQEPNANEPNFGP
jgi:hypothetical protein